MEGCVLHPCSQATGRIAVRPSLLLVDMSKMMALMCGERGWRGRGLGRKCKVHAAVEANKTCGA